MTANWYEDFAYPLHAALDDATDMDNASIDERWKAVVDACPWLVMRVMAAQAPVPEIGEAADWTLLKSSNLDAFRVVGKTAARPDGTIDPFAHDIEVRFKNGSTYRYAGVKQEDIDGLLAAESPGGYFSTWIRNRYKSEKIG